MATRSWTRHALPMTTEPSPTAGHHIRTFAEHDRVEVVRLWERCGLTRPWNDPDLDIDRKVAADPAGLLVAVDRDTVVGSVMAGHDGHRGWINYLAVDPQQQRSGVGRRLMEAAEAVLRARGCPKINLQIRQDNEAAVGFYRQLGYDVDPVVSMGKDVSG